MWLYFLIFLVLQVLIFAVKKEIYFFYWSKLKRKILFFKSTLDQPRCQVVFFQSKKGERLIHFLCDFNVLLKSGEWKNLNAMPNYKYFTRLLTKLLLLMKERGGDVDAFISQSKKIIASDVEWEKKVEKEIKSALLQMFSMSFFILAFVLLSDTILEIKKNKQLYFFILALHGAGLMLFIFILGRFRRRWIDPIGKLIETHYFFKMSLESGMGLSEALDVSNVQHTAFSNQQKYQSLFSFFNLSIEHLKNKGESPLANCQMIIDSLWFEASESLEKLKKATSFLKFLILVCFFLSSYFLYCLSLFKFFMEL